MRTYHFQSWLLFSDDQARDAYLSGQAATGATSWPLLGPNMNNTGVSVETYYHLGPIYYYFQIISVKIFGNNPASMAYPDLFFSILSLPLFYVFSKTFFSRKISLSLVLLYALSSYFISYSRFAWNTNLIPFFVLLFLFSVHKFLDYNEKTQWLWVVCLGVAWGVGFQLHALTMVLFSLTALYLFLFSMKKNYHVWTKWLIVAAIFLVMNIGQIASEVKTNFANTKILLNYSFMSNSGNVSKPTLLGNDTDCHLEANLFFLTSYSYSDSSKCTYDFSKAKYNFQTKSFSKNLKDKNYWLMLLASLLFSVVGYAFLIYYSFAEKDQSKKYFLRLVGMYAAAFYLILLPLSAGQYKDFRYLAAVFFVPFFFLGFMFKFVSERFHRCIFLMAAIFLLLIYSNVSVISAKASELANGNAACSNSPTLGEIEPVADYIAAASNGQKNIYIGGDNMLSADIRPVMYLLGQRGVYNIESFTDEVPNSPDGTVFSLSCNPKKNNLDSYQRIGNIYVLRAIN